MQLERQAGEWFFVGGYAGEAVTNRRSILNFSPERGFTKAFLGRAGRVYSHYRYGPSGKAGTAA